MELFFMQVLNLSRSDFIMVKIDIKDCFLSRSDYIIVISCKSLSYYNIITT
jgi:hypothetical protein